MPIAFKRKVIKIKCQFFTFDNPIKLMPISSGSGEAIINAPAIGINQVKNGLRKSFFKNEPRTF